MTFKSFVSVAVLSFSTLKNLKMTLSLWICTKTEKYFLNIKLISVASTNRKVKFHVSNSFDIASIYSTYLSKIKNPFDMTNRFRTSHVAELRSRPTLYQFVTLKRKAFTSNGPRTFYFRSRSLNRAKSRSYHKNNEDLHFL